MISEERRDWLKEYYRKNKERINERRRTDPEVVKVKKAYARKHYTENREKYIDYSKSRYQENKDYYRHSSIKRRAKVLGLDFNLDVEDVKHPEVCPVLGFKLVRSLTGTPGPSSPSVDRINTKLGYVKGNVQVISNKANTMKSDATPEELRMFARWVLKTFPEEPDDQT